MLNLEYTKTNFNIFLSKRYDFDIFHEALYVRKHVDQILSFLHWKFGERWKR